MAEQPIGYVGLVVSARQQDREHGESGYDSGYEKKANVAGQKVHHWPPSLYVRHP
jgi:hypothetical protein